MNSSLAFRLLRAYLVLVTEVNPLKGRGFAGFNLSPEF